MKKIEKVKKKIRYKMSRIVIKEHEGRELVKKDPDELKEGDYPYKYVHVSEIYFPTCQTGKNIHEYLNNNPELEIKSVSCTDISNGTRKCTYILGLIRKVLR